MFPLLLHLGVHNEEGVMRKMDRDWTFGICPEIIPLAFDVVGLVRFVSSSDLADTELASNSKAETTDDCSGAQIGELI